MDGGDDWVADRRAGVAGDRLHRHAEGFPSLALQVQEILDCDPLSGHLFCFRGRAGNLLKVIWHDGQGRAAPGTGPLPVAEPSRWCGDDLVGAARVPAVRHRLEAPAGDVAADIGGMTIFALPSPANRFCCRMTSAPESLPSDLVAAHAMILAERAARREAEAKLPNACAEAALIAYYKLEIEKLRRQLYGTRAERKAWLLEQMELELEELEATATENELAAEKAAARTQTVKSFQRKRPGRKPFPDHLPRERVVMPAPPSCPCCGSSKLSKLGEDITETLEVVPRQWKVIQTVREKFSCRECERITQPAAPFHVTPRGFAGPNLLAMILFEKFGQHQPWNRQSERYRREGIDLACRH